MDIKSLYVDQNWELRCIDKICQEIRNSNFIDLEKDKVAILQLSYEYSGLMAQIMAHKLSSKDEPIDIEPVNIPYQNEFEPFIHPDQLDPYTKLVVVDSGCISGNNFQRIYNKLIDYGFSTNHLFFTCIACDLGSIFKPNFCPIYFDGKQHMIHFWWETKTNKFRRN